jgi:hypothetical protein
MVLNKVHDIHIGREVTVSNFEVMGKLVDLDNHDEDVESAFGDRDVTVAAEGNFYWCVWAVGCIAQDTIDSFGIMI